jgi:hypothetical protein
MISEPTGKNSNMKLRAVLACAALAALVAFAACTTTTNSNGTTTVTVSLATAQAEATTIMNALNQEGANLIATLPANVQPQLTTALKSLGAAEAAFIALPASGVTVAQAATAFVQAAEGVVAILPLPATTQLALDGGFTLVNALIAGLSSITVPVAPTTTASLVTGAGIVNGPIPIPVSH